MNLLSTLKTRPLVVVFIASLLLSLISLAGLVGPNRDGMLYVETANIFNEEGLAAAKANFDPVFFPVLIALFSRATGLETELAGYALNALLLAGACASAVALTRKLFPEATELAILAALALPALNEYRFDLIRENGYWLLCLLALLTTLRWREQPSWRNALVTQVCLFGAVCFRAEAVAYFLALFIWAALSTPGDYRQRLRNALQLNSLAVLGGLIGILLLLVNGDEFSHRFAHYVADGGSPFSENAKFAVVANALANGLLPAFSADEARRILWVGVLSIIPFKWIELTGILLLPLAYGLRRSVAQERLRHWQICGAFLLVYLAILMVFVTYQLFLTGRYVSLLAILTLPLIAVGLHDLLARWPRLKWPVIALCVLLALSHVVSLSKDKKTQFREAGQWLAAQPQMQESIYLDSPRTGYYAGKAYRKLRHLSLTREQIEEAARNGQFTYFVFEVRRKDKELEPWVTSLGLREIQRFSNRTGDAVVIFQRAPTP